MKDKGTLAPPAPISWKIPEQDATSGRRDFFHKLVAAVAVSGISGLLLGRSLQPASAGDPSVNTSGNATSGQIPYFSTSTDIEGATISGLAPGNMTWNGTNLTVWGSGYGGVPAPTAIQAYGDVYISDGGLSASFAAPGAGLVSVENTDTSNTYDVGVYGQSDGPNGNGVKGNSTNTTTSTGGQGVLGIVEGQAPPGTTLAGVMGLANTGYGVYGSSSSGTGVSGTSNSTSSGATAVVGTISSSSPGGYSAGVRGVNNGTGTLGIGVYGSHAGSGWGVYGTSSGYGVYGYSESSIGGAFQGGVAAIYANGKVGIGTSTPTQALTIVGGSIQLDNAQQVYTKTSAGASVTLFSTDTSNNCYFGSPLLSGNLALEAGGGIVFYTGGGYQRAYFDSTGRFITASTVTIQSLPANGGSAVYESGGLLGLAASDRRLKKDIKTIPNALASIQRMRGVRFRWKKPGEAFPKGRRLGVVAQEVQKVYPELIHKTGDGYLGVDTECLVAPLIEAVKELAEQHRELAEQIRELKKELAEQKR